VRGITSPGSAIVRSNDLVGVCEGDCLARLCYSAF
jgi:hypothetical protein